MEHKPHYKAINPILLGVLKTIMAVKEFDDIRLATVEEILAMKIDVISRFGRKKDFWDIHELKDDYPIDKMIALHKERYPYNHDPKKIISSFTDFEIADENFDPICLKGKIRELIKLDLTDMSDQVSKP